MKEFGSTYRRKAQAKGLVVLPVDEFFFFKEDCGGPKY